MNCVCDIIRDCLENKTGIKQVFIFTHNIYFHKEITFCGAKEKQYNKLKSYFVIRKDNEISNINTYSENPISTSYELLWQELRSQDKINAVSAFNAMRRILEYYYTIIGDIDYEQVINTFEGDEKIACKALLACMNDGSHDIVDDLFVSPNMETIGSYLTAFKRIFTITNHETHYSMMMMLGRD